MNKKRKKLGRPYKTEPKFRQFTITLDDELFQKIDEFVGHSKYFSKSEFCREVFKKFFEEDAK